MRLRYLLVRPFGLYFLSAYSVPGAAPGDGDTAVNKIDQVPTEYSSGEQKGAM